MIKKYKRKQSHVKKMSANEKKPHLWINMTGSHSYGNFVNSHLFLNITTYYCDITGEERICLILPGEHVYVYRESYVAYTYSRIITDFDASVFATSNTFTHYPPTEVSDSLYDKICNGFLGINGNEININVSHQEFLKDYLDKNKNKRNL